MKGKSLEAEHRSVHRGPRRRHSLRDLSRFFWGAFAGAVFVLMIQVAVARRSSERTSISSQAQIFAETMDKLEREYVEPVDRPAYWQALSRCATQSLDAYTYVLNQEERLRQQEPSPYGLSLSRRPGHSGEGPLRVVALTPGGAAQRAGIELGMRIDAINGRSARTMVKQSEIDLALRPLSFAPLVVRAGKRRFTLAAIRGKDVPEGLLEGRAVRCGPAKGVYLKIAGFRKGLAPRVRAWAERAKSKDAAGMVLDLRGNPGGEIDAAIAIADLFLESGLITRIRARGGRVKKEYRASKAQTLPLHLPLVVMIDGYTASAAELLVAALQDHQRALVVGDPSFGKGSIQRIHSFSDGSVLRYTTGRYFSPLDHALDQRGVLPDLHWHSARRGMDYSDVQLCALIRRVRN